VLNGVDLQDQSPEALPSTPAPGRYTDEHRQVNRAATLPDSAATGLAGRDDRQAAQYAKALARHQDRSRRAAGAAAWPQ
jgi:hypothetical protein